MDDSDVTVTFTDEQYLILHRLLTMIEVGVPPKFNKEELRAVITAHNRLLVARHIEED